MCNYVQLCATSNCTWGSTLVLEEVWETTGRRQVNPMKNSMGNKCFAGAYDHIFAGPMTYAQN